MLRAMARLAAFLLTATLLLPPANRAYEATLASRSAPDAYFLGQPNNEDREGFLRLAALISLSSACSTLYAQAVEISGHKTVGYSAQQTEADTRGAGFYRGPCGHRLHGNLQPRDDRQAGEGRWKPAEYRS